MKIIPLTALFGASFIATMAMAHAPEDSRYMVEIHLVENGKTVVHANTYLSEKNGAFVSLNADGDHFEFDANLATQQGDGGDYNIVTSFTLIRNGEAIASPQMLMRPQATSRYVTGVEGVDMVSVTIKPALSDPS